MGGWRVWGALCLLALGAVGYEWGVHRLIDRAVELGRAEQFTASQAELDRLLAQARLPSHRSRILLELALNAHDQGDHGRQRALGLQVAQEYAGTAEGYLGAMQAAEYEVLVTRDYDGAVALYRALLDQVRPRWRGDRLHTVRQAVLFDLAWAFEQAGREADRQAVLAQLQAEYPDSAWLEQVAVATAGSWREQPAD